MKSKLKIAKFYLKPSAVVCFDKGPDMYEGGCKSKNLYGWAFFLGPLTNEGFTKWVWLETKDIRKSECILERNIFV